MSKEPGYLGQRGLNRKLRKMGPEITDVMKPRMQKVGEEAKFTALSYLSRTRRTGDLMDALHFVVDSRGLSVKVGYWRKGNIKRWRQAGWRAHFIEFGTSKAPAFKFLVPTFNDIRKGVARDIDKDVGKALKRVARNGK